MRTRKSQPPLPGLFEGTQPADKAGAAGGPGEQGGFPSSTWRWAFPQCSSPRCRSSLNCKSAPGARRGWFQLGMELL